MYDTQFWNSKLGQAAIASVLAMTAMLAVSTQFQATQGSIPTLADVHAVVELA